MNLFLRRNLICRFSLALIFLFYNVAGVASDHQQHSHVGAPISFDQWQSSDGLVTAPCPPGWQCGVPLLDDGFMQRNITDIDGHKYMQTVMIDAEATALLGRQAHEGLAYVNETFISLGHGKNLVEEKRSTWDHQSGVAFSQRIQDIDGDALSFFVSEVSGTAGLLLDLDNEFFIRQTIYELKNNEKFEAEFIFERGLHFNDCCDDTTELRGGHEFAPGHANGHKKGGRGKGHLPGESDGPELNAHYGEILLVLQSLMSDGFNDEFSYSVHRHYNDNGSEENKELRLSEWSIDVAGDPFQENTIIVADNSNIFLEKGGNSYPAQESTDYIVSVIDEVSSGAAVADRTQKKRQSNSSQSNSSQSNSIQSNSIKRADKLSQRDVVQMLDPFDETFKASTLALNKKESQMTRRQIIDPFI